MMHVKKLNLLSVLISLRSHTSCSRRTSPQNVNERPRRQIDNAYSLALASDELQNNLVRAQSTGNDVYFQLAERDIDVHWEKYVWPYIYAANFTHVLEIACGHCRNTNKLKDLSKKISAVDINPDNVAFCKRRFGGRAGLEFYVTDGVSISKEVPPTVTFVYSFDAMVHFDVAVVASYLMEASRVMLPGALGYFHHSQTPRCPAKLPSGFCSEPDIIGDDPANPHQRNSMSKQMFVDAAVRAGLEVVMQTPLTWDSTFGETDCISVFRKPQKDVGVSHTHILL